VDLRLLRRIAQALLRDTQPNERFDLGVYLVAAPEMTRLNETFLRHQGSTDVITFNYAELPESESLHGEIFVCLDEAECQARRFRTTWQSELVRYVVHGVLHLLGYDDQQSRARLRMRAAENDLVRRLAHEFAFRDLRPAPERKSSPARRQPTTIRAHEKHTRSTRGAHEEHARNTRATRA
jgi:probable rRNA maturation factor